jgi:preprotein translocase subunit YajC
VNDLAALLPIILLVAIFYLFIIRPQGKRRREFLSMQERVVVGSRVMLTSGVFGTVKALDDETMTLEIAPGVDIEVHRNVVAKIIDGTDAGTATHEVVETHPIEDEDGKA